MSIKKIKASQPNIKVEGLISISKSKKFPTKQTAVL
jgi:hypothetical protein